MIVRTSELTRVLTAPNPGPMTLDGTNSYLLGAPGSSSLVVVDPGPEHAGHLQALAAAGRIELILITHHHLDHTEGSAELHGLTGAPVRAVEPACCHGGQPLFDGEVIEAAGVSIRVIATPGHSGDSVSFVLADDGPHGSVLTGDTILGRGTTMLSPEAGSLADYLQSLRTLRELGEATVLPAHGPVLASLVAICDEYLAHREQRLDRVRAALATLGPDASVAAVTDIAYSEVDSSVRFAAEHSVESQLDYLRSGN
ncbi:MAG: fold metallo-hydrolase [Microbacteriaceae bacterium]|nr:fold metallo-hydrolase [Microbacteriaceae bacterium]